MRVHCRAPRMRYTATENFSGPGTTPGPETGTEPRITSDPT